jgi:hypothetical protein
MVAQAQQGDRMRRIGVLVSYDENDSGPVWVGEAPCALRRK